MPLPLLYYFSYFPFPHLRCSPPILTPLVVAAVGRYRDINTTTIRRAMSER